MTDANKIIQAGIAVLVTEAEAITALKTRIGEHFVNACQKMLECHGRIVVSGMGKSGHIARKIAATLASTGSPAFFVHPAEASHGDLGMVKADDVFVAISYSGTSTELLLIMPMIKRMGVPIITLTGKTDSAMAKLGTFNLDVSVSKEACPLGLAPTASTTATLAMGDALAIALLDARGFSMDDFAFSHPGGALGRRLLLQVSDIMVTGNNIPTALSTTLLRDVLINMSQFGFGMTIVVDDKNCLLGIFTDGDLRRVIDLGADLLNTPVIKVMTPHGQSISKDMLATEALDRMEQYKITAMPVIDKENHVIGAIKMHDMLSSGVV